MTFAERLKQLMGETGLSERALSEASGVAYGTVHTYAIGRRAPSLENAIRLARALGTDTRAFESCSFKYQRGRSAPRPKGKTK